MIRPLAVLAIALLAACEEEAPEAPKPVAYTEETLGHVCMMLLGEHEGPKAQLHLRGLPEPLFFTQVRDALAYLKGPEREGMIAALYVSDMAEAPNWEEPGADNWIAADDAVFVVGADVRGGMGAPEVVPFGDAEAAAAFAAEHGGALLALEDIPAEAVLGAIEVDRMEAD